LDTAVHGRILFEEEVSSLDGAVVHVFLEDTTRADGPAVVRVHQHSPPVVVAERTLAFTLPAIPVDRRADYTVRVLIDRDGDGRVSRGDYISTASHPVLTWGHPADVVVSVRRVT
jgi:uncharacterized lipoprotein YbaY